MTDDLRPDRVAPRKRTLKGTTTMPNQPNNTDEINLPGALAPSNVADLPDSALIAFLAQGAILPRKLDEGVYAIKHESGGIDVVETPGYRQEREHDWKELHAERPEQIYADRTVRDVPSFLAYLAANTQDNPGVIGEDHALGTGSLEVWADPTQNRITGVLDGLDGWARHTATLVLRPSREWKEWTAVSGRLLGQTELAEFVEDHLSTIARPDGGLLLDVCQSLEATVGASFKSASRLQDGQRSLRYEETIEASAGRKGDVKVPEELTLVLRVFEGSEPIAVRAAFRFRISGGELRLGVKLLDADRIVEDAFNAVVSEIQPQVPVPVYFGTR